MKTAIIGLGNIGAAVAANLASGKADVIVAGRELGKSQELAKKLGPTAQAMTVDAALKAADVVVLAIWFDAIKTFLAEHRNELVGKIIVDPSNPIAPDGKGGFKKIIPETDSSGAIFAASLPPGAKLVKAFGTLGAASLNSAANRSPERAVLFYAADDAAAGTAVAHLLEVSGFSPVNVGGIKQSIRIEVFGDLHEYGKLGKLVTAKEAKALLDAAA